ncbi:MAG: hypothetical protein NTU65_03005 [Cyanobacteria bacterium]|nr:hypothetical protein [Cyanobacteriota bacterium]
MGSHISNASFLSQASQNRGPYRANLEHGQTLGASAPDHVDSYFECITACSLDDGECVTRCVETLRDNS